MRVWCFWLWKKMGKIVFALFLSHIPLSFEIYQRKLLYILQITNSHVVNAWNYERLSSIGSCCTKIFLFLIWGLRFGVTNCVCTHYLEKFSTGDMGQIQARLMFRSVITTTCTYHCCSSLSFCCCLGEIWVLIKFSVTLWLL